MDVAITELEKIDAERVDGVAAPASGIPILLMKTIAPEVVKGQRDCPKCSKNHDADFKGDNCENCGTKLPDADAAKAAAPDAVDCPTCKGDGKIMAGKRDCPDCDAKGKVTPAKAKTLAAKSVAKAVRVASFPGGMAKAIGADGQVDEQPDIDKANQILALLGEAMQAEAAEMAAGHAGEAGDIIELAYASQAVRQWRDGEQAVSLGDVMPASALAQSAAGGSDDDASKGAIAPGGTDVDTVTKGTGDLQKAVEAANAEVASLKKLRVELEETLAKVKATPVPGGPVLSHNVQRKQAGGVASDDLLAKAALYRQKAADATAPADREGYLALARETEDKAQAKPA